MFQFNSNAGFAGIMLELLQERGIYNIGAPDFNTKVDYADINKEISSCNCFTEIDGITTTFFKYFGEAIDIYNQRTHSTMPINCVFFKTTNGKRAFLYSLEKKDDYSFILKAQTNKSLTYMKNILFGSRDNPGITSTFELHNKELLNTLFTEKKLAFRNHYLAMIYGIKQLSEQIDKVRDEQFKNIPIPKYLESDIFDLFESSIEGFDDKNFNYATYIIMVFAFIEHVGMLTLPFWFSMQDTHDYWKYFCNGMHYPHGFDTFRDFYTSKIDWIDSFIFTICKNSYDSKTDDYTKSEKKRMLIRLYKKLRYDYRNPLHHGISTGTEMTGLSLEVPSLKNKVNVHVAPLIKNIDYSAFSETRKFYNLFIELWKEHEPEIFKYIYTGWNVPTDCTELVSYIKDNNMDEFIDEYNRLLSHIG